MSKASNVVASVAQQSTQWILQYRTEYREHPKATWVQTKRRHDEQQLMTSGGALDDVAVPSRRLERNRQLDTEAQYQWGSDESRWQLYTTFSGMKDSSLQALSVMHQLCQAAVKLLVPVITWAAAMLHSSHVAVCWWWLLEPRRERPYNSPPVTLQRRGQVLPQNPRLASAEYVGVNKGQRPRAGWGFGGGWWQFKC